MKTFLGLLIGYFIIQGLYEAGVTLIDVLIFVVVLYILSQIYFSWIDRQS